MAKDAKKIVGIEVVPQAVENARENAKLNGIQNTEYYCGTAEELAPRLRGEKPDVVILDPPYDETGYYDTVMDMLQRCGLLDEGGIVVAEHLYDNKLSDTYGGLKRFKEKKYGSIGVDVYML